MLRANILSLFLFIPLFSSPLFADSRIEVFRSLGNGNQKAITYPSTGCRFGDNLLAYLHARWLSYKYNLPFLYRQFPYSDQLSLHEIDFLRLDLHKFFFKKFWVLQQEQDILKISGPALITVPYFPLSEIELETQPAVWSHRFTIDWENLEFKQLIRTLTAPRFSIATLEMPSDLKLSVAVHVRKGGGVDPENTWLCFPLKFPPDSFYIAAIRTMSELFYHEPMYLYIFTDDLDPPKIVRRYQEALPDLKNIRFDCRKSNNGPGVNVVEDFFSIQKFDCLIRPDSNYSMVAEKLKDFQVVISPKDPRIENGVEVIDTIHIKRQSLF